MGETTGGTYTLVVELDRPATIEVGALGSLAFEEGWYAYVGSARGPGGFSRVERHRELAAGERETRHWHIDSLLGHPAASVVGVVRTAGVDGECAVARAVGGERIPRFGCSDCGCDSHLLARDSREALLATVERAHRSLDGETTREGSLAGTGERVE
jgi:Uri superfamily endonuclease